MMGMLKRIKAQAIMGSVPQLRNVVRKMQVVPSIPASPSWRQGSSTFVATSLAETALHDKDVTSDSSCGTKGVLPLMLTLLTHHHSSRCLCCLLVLLCNLKLPDTSLAVILMFVSGIELWPRTSFSATGHFFICCHGVTLTKSVMVTLGYPPDGVAQGRPVTSRVTLSHPPRGGSPRFLEAFSLSHPPRVISDVTG